MEQKLTMKDKKTDMIKAYEELLTRYTKEKDERATGKEANAKKANELAVVKKASTYTVDGVVKGLADLKLDLSKTLGDLSDNLTAEANKLHELREAIAIETRNLEEIYDIKVAAMTLDNLIREHEEKKKSFEEEATDIRREWKKEQEEYELIVKERDEKLKKEREREAEEYNYNLFLTRKKDKDAYEQEKGALEKALKEKRETQEKELSERVAEVAAQEAEIAELRTNAESFPAQLAKAVEKARIEAAAESEKHAKQKADLLAKEVEGEKKLSELKIKTLEDTVAKQASQIKDLTGQLNNATSQVQDIASKAIEGASGAKALTSINKIALEQAKNVRDTK